MCWIIFCFDIRLVDWNWCMNHTVWWVKLTHKRSMFSNFETKIRNLLAAPLTLNFRVWRGILTNTHKRYQRDSSLCKPFELIHLSLRKFCCVLMLQRKHLCEAFFEDFCSQESWYKTNDKILWQVHEPTCLILHDFLSYWGIKYFGIPEHSTWHLKIKVLIKLKLNQSSLLIL